MTQPRRRPGRRPGPGGTREHILATARAAFAAEGYDGMSLRRVARAAGVDPALVLHYFDSKDGLFTAAMQLPVNPGAVVAEVLAGGTDGLGERLARLFLQVWDVAPEPLLGLFRSAMTHEHAAAMLREFVTDAILGPVAAAVDRPEPRLRAALAGTQLVGLAMVRYGLRVEPLASAPAGDIVAAVGPTLQRYLTGELPV